MIVVYVFSMENWKWTLLIVFVRAARPSVGKKQRNSESLARGCGTCGAVVDKRALPLHVATSSLKGMHTACY